MLSLLTRRRCPAMLGAGYLELLSYFSPQLVHAPILPSSDMIPYHSIGQRAKSCHQWPQRVRVDLGFMLPGTIVLTDRGMLTEGRDQEFGYSGHGRHHTMLSTWSCTCQIAHLFLFSPQSHPQGCGLLSPGVPSRPASPRIHSTHCLRAFRGTEYPAGHPVPVQQPLWLPVMANLHSV